jgi:hypothetical protein
MAVIHENLAKSGEITKRALYYRQVDIASKQADVDRGHTTTDPLHATHSLHVAQSLVLTSALCSHRHAVLDPAGEA